MSYSSGRKKVRKPIYDAESGVPPTEAQMVKMRRQADNVALYWLNQKRLTVSEMREKLTRKKLVEEVVEAKVAELVEKRLLDDESFVEDFIYFRQDSLSKRQIVETLLRRGIAQNIIDDMIVEVTDESQREGALKIARRRAKSTVREGDAYKRRSKIVSSVVSKGYGFELATKVSDEALEEFPAVERSPSSLADRWRVDAEEGFAFEAVEESVIEAEAYRLAESKVRATRSKKDVWKRKQSIMNSLIRKGYSFTVASAACEEALKNEKAG